MVTCVSVIFLFLPSIMYFVFVIFNDILFAINQQGSVFNSLLTVVIRLGSEVSDAYIVESSAKSIALRMSDELGKSFM